MDGKCHISLKGPTNIFDKTCPWASGRQKELARQEDLVVQYIARWKITSSKINSCNLQSKRVKKVQYLRVSANNLQLETNFF